MNEVITFEQRAKMLNIYLKSVKRSLPKNCTFLALFKKADGTLYVNAFITNSKNQKEKFLYTMPQDLDFTPADIEHLKTLLLEKCNEYVG